MGESEGDRRTATRMRAASADEVAWIVLIPWALVALAAIVLLGPPLGHALFSPGSERLWPEGWWETQGNPIPVTQGRYAVAALAPALLAGAILAGARRPPRLPPQLVRGLVWADSAGVLALVVAALLQQNAEIKPGKPAPPTFGPVAAAVAGALVVAAIALLQRPGVSGRIAALARETRARHAAGLAVAIAFAAIWLLKGLLTDKLAGDLTGWNFPYTLNDAIAVLDGRTPLADYHVIYAKLLPYPTALVLGTFGTTIFVYTAFMAVLNGLALLAVYAVFRRVARSSLAALALFLPFVALSDVDYVSTPAGAVSPLTLSAVWPMRYGGVYLLAWLTARHLDGRRPRGAWVVLLVGGLVAINNLELGVAAVVATLVALLCARPPRSRDAALRLAASAAAGLLAAVAVVAVVTLARAGELPHPSLLLEWPRIFTRLGWFSLPLPIWGLHVAIYATFAAAVAVAAVRLARRDDAGLLTAMLAWSGAFGLLAGGYFVGRPDAQRLDTILSTWAFALALLTVAVVRALAARGWRRPAPAELLVLFGFGLALTMLSHLPQPQKQIARLTKARLQPVYQATADRFVKAHTRRGEKVVILLPMSYRISHDLGLRNVAPYGFMNAIITKRQMRTVVQAVRREHVREVFTPAPGSFLLREGDASPPQLQMLLAAGFRVGASEAGMLELRKA